MICNNINSGYNYLGCFSYFPSSEQINAIDKGTIFIVSGKEYIVINNGICQSSIAGLYSIGSPYGLVFADSYVGFLQVSSIEIAKHLSTYFGKLIFEVLYGGPNCDWEWVE